MSAVTQQRPTVRRAERPQTRPGVRSTRRRGPADRSRPRIGAPRRHGAPPPAVHRALPLREALRLGAARRASSARPSAGGAWHLTDRGVSVVAVLLFAMLASGLALVVGQFLAVTGA